MCQGIKVSMDKDVDKTKVKGSHEVAKKAPKENPLVIQPSGNTGKLNGLKVPGMG